MLRRAGPRLSRREFAALELDSRDSAKFYMRGAWQPFSSTCTAARMVMVDGWWCRLETQRASEPGRVGVGRETRPKGERERERGREKLFSNNPASEISSGILPLFLSHFLFRALFPSISAVVLDPEMKRGTFREWSSRHSRLNYLSHDFYLIFLELISIYNLNRQLHGGMHCGMSLLNGKRAIVGQM